MEWNEETIARLRELWADGLSTAEIGRRMVVSKNAVVGKAHRLGLDARPSPIRRGLGNPAGPRPVPSRRPVGPTLPPLPVDHAADAAAASAKLAPAAEPAVAAPAVPVVVPVQMAAVPTVAAAAATLAPARAQRRVACCWPIGEPGTKSFRFCDVDALHGKPYCPDHAQLAYVKVRDRREEAA